MAFSLKRDNGKVKRSAFYLLILALIISPAQSQDKNKQAKVRRDYTESELNRFKVPGPSASCQGGESGVSLYDPGRSLHQAKQQDQDGLSTCYANTASLILKSYNPNLPTPSYLSLAAYNSSSPDKNYDFNLGYTCDVLNKWKKDQKPLCGDEILENQPIEIQDKILFKLYDAVNKHHYKPDQMLKVLATYEDYLASHPMPPKRSCLENAHQLTFDQYIDGKLAVLTEDYSFYPDREDGMLTPAEESFAKNCSQQFKRKLLESNLVDEKTIKYDDGTSSVYYEFKSQITNPMSDQYQNFFKNHRHNSGTTYYESLVKLLDSQATQSATYEHVIGETTKSKQYITYMDKMVREANAKILKQFRDSLVDNNPELKACLDKAKDRDEPQSELFFNSLLGQCQSGEMKEWRNKIWESTQSCVEVEKDLFDVFKTLSALGQSVEDIKKFIVNQDKNILSQIVDKNCSKSYQYQVPKNDCSVTFVPPDLGNIQSAAEWSIYQWFMKDLEAYMKKNGLKTMINLELYVQSLVKRLDSINLQKEEKSEDQLTAYRNFLGTLYRKLPKEEMKSYSLDKFKKRGLEVAQEAKAKQVGQGLNITNSIAAGYAVGIGTCGSIFSDKEKRKYIGCANHSVAATGYKCVDGRLKIELTNSWGVGCQDGDKTRNLFECEVDQDGLTNGRAWVDYDYLSDQAMRAHSF